MIGNRLGSYEITAKLGEGGMGEDIAPDGQHLLSLRLLESAREVHAINCVDDWVARTWRGLESAR